MTTNDRRAYAEALQRLLGNRPGSHQTTCPECSQERTKAKARCVQAYRHADRITWHCYHCGASGTWFTQDGGAGRVAGQREHHRRAGETWSGYRAVDEVRRSVRDSVWVWR